MLFITSCSISQPMFIAREASTPESKLTKLDNDVKKVEIFQRRGEKSPLLMSVQERNAVAV